MGAEASSPPLPEREPLLQALLARLLTADQGGAIGVADRATALGWSVDDVRLSLIQPALVEIGERWERAQIGVAEEHLASSVCEWLLYALAGRTPRRAPTGRRAVVGCSDDERHSIGARIVAHMLAEQGWQVLYLGAATPAEAWEGVVRARRPEVALLSTTISAKLAPVPRTVEAIKAARQDCRTVVGGQAYRRQAGAHAGVGADLLVLDARALASSLG